MSNAQKANGACLCGSVKINVDELKNNVGVCHCGMCRKWAGGPMMSVDCGTEVIFEDNEDQIGVFNSSEWAERGFCKKCGTSLFYRLKMNNQYIMPVGLFENLDGLNFDHQIYIDHKPEFYEFSNKTHNMTEAEVIAAYSPDSE